MPDRRISILPFLSGLVLFGISGTLSWPEDLLAEQIIFSDNFEALPLVKEQWVIEDQAEYHDYACDSPLLFLAIPAHLDDNGLRDLIVHYWCPAETNGEFDDQPTEDALVTWLNQGGGDFEPANEQLFGRKQVQLGGAARKYDSGDLNQDGRKDFIFAMNWEDGRLADDASTNAARPAIMLSSGQSSYEIVQLGERVWGHAARVVPNAEGTSDAVFIGFTDPGLQAFRWDNGSWNDVSSSYPTVARHWATGFEVLPLDDSMDPNDARIIGTYSESGQTGVHLMHRGSSGWQELDKFLFEVLFEVDMLTWNGTVAPTDVVEINGERYLGPAMTETCFVEELFEGGNPAIIGMISGNRTRSGDPIEEGKTYEQGPPVNILVFFELVDNQLTELPSPIIDEVIETNYNFYSCKDLTGDSLPDISASVHGTKPLVYLSDGVGQMKKANLDPIQGHSYATGRGIFADMNNDDVEDLILLGTNGGADIGDIEIRILGRDLNPQIEAK